MRSARKESPPRRDLSRRDLAELPGQIRLLHGRGDPIIPFTESQRLQRALPAARTRLYLTDGLVHADLRGVSLGDAASLLDLTYDLLSWRDAASRPALTSADAAGH